MRELVGEVDMEAVSSGAVLLCIVSISAKSHYQSVTWKNSYRSFTSREPEKFARFHVCRVHDVDQADRHESRSVIATPFTRLPMGR
jgi:hypothetical protein